MEEIENAMFPKRGIPKEDPFAGESIGSEKLKSKLRDFKGKMTLKDTLKLINRLRAARGESPVDNLPKSVKKTKIRDSSSNIDTSRPMPRVRYSASSTTRRFR